MFAANSYWMIGGTKVSHKSSEMYSLGLVVLNIDCFAYACGIQSSI